ncbi:MAG: type I-E CRISPR-associated protein Cse1/CasA [Elusimicrobia bacterium GWC2_51_8]|nr:MAG: type I-E CRISPR-associated protein Cse1/CasA [Elusimicrobia bacterium GWA2_51_34]OGR59551.1 MAG: type I-E CRISPR-associated protein Cse1/CasA [Elusimicrobia bacterium GWC2_51_8]HAF94470.1 type I-E CRISPR-associated protein Cse1/CasA [Elusimicrobiota bacterium]HCE98973.1 type I-E CRISPR-associated protein Cse1/CasA [Elusimicrobiota bacterium]
MSRFNLIDEKWIPVRFLNGTRNELGIMDTLLRSSEIAAIEDQSPLVVAALHRFLLAVLYRALEGPTDIDQAKNLFKTGLPKEKIKTYLEKWRNRFWLFDEKYPFGQNPHIPEDEIEPWTKLTAEYNAPSNKVLFDHTDAKKPGEMELKTCARCLLSTMNFSISGGRGYYPSPSSNAIMCIPLGRELHETLCYSLVPYPNRNVMAGDSALWEREPEKLPLKNSKRMASGYADLYTWQSRMILLQDVQAPGVETMRFVSGQGFDNSSKNHDPMQAYRLSEIHGVLPVQFREDKGVWRDFYSLLPDDSGFAPLTIQNAIKLAGSKVDKMPKSVLALGLRYEPPSANVSFWRMEHFVLPSELTGDRFIRTEIHQLLEDANHVQKVLWMACSCFAQFLLSRGERKPDKRDVSEFIKQIPAIPRYWSILESHFHEVLGDYAADCDPDEIRCRWLNHVRDTLKMVWEQYAASVLEGDAWAIRALVKAEGAVRDKVKELDGEMEKCKKQEVNQ